MKREAGTQTEQVQHSSSPQGAAKNAAAPPGSKPAPIVSPVGGPGSNFAHKEKSTHMPDLPRAGAPQADLEKLDQLWRPGAEGRSKITRLGRALDQLWLTLSFGTRVLTGAEDHGQDDAMLMVPLESALVLLESALEVFPTKDAPAFLNAVWGCHQSLAMAERVLAHHVICPEQTALEDFDEAWEKVTYTTCWLRKCFLREFGGCQHMFDAIDKSIERRSIA